MPMQEHMSVFGQSQQHCGVTSGPPDGLGKQSKTNSEVYASHEGWANSVGSARQMHTTTLTRIPTGEQTNMAPKMNSNEMLIIGGRADEKLTPKADGGTITLVLEDQADKQRLFAQESNPEVNQLP